MEKQLNSFLKDLRKVTDSTSFASSKFGSIEEYIDTGDYGLNRILSGSIYKGIPSGRVVLIGGESATGKSFIAAQIAANALNQCDYDLVFYFDAEGGAMKEFFDARGCDTNKIEQVLVSSIKDAAIKIISTYNKIAELKKVRPEFKALCILDSLGALVDDKFLTDVDKGKVAQDMGARAKLCNKMMKALTIPALKTNCSMIVVNHVYDDPASMFPSKIKKQGGGKGLQYMARITLQCTRANVKEEESKAENAYKATILKFMTVKNSIVKPFFTSEMYLDFSEGPHRYFGLLASAVKMGYIDNSSQGYYVVPSYSEKKYRLKELLDTPAAWESFLADFDIKSQELLAYSGSGAELREDNLTEIMDEAITEKYIDRDTKEI